MNSDSLAYFWGYPMVPLRHLEVSFAWIQSLDHFDVTVFPDTIAHSDSSSTIIYVQAKDSLNQNICSYDGTIQVSASPTGYGDLGDSYSSDEMEESNASSQRVARGSLAGTKYSVMGHQNKGATISGVQSLGENTATVDGPLMIDYWDANNGYLFYAADGTVPGTNTTITFTVSAVDKPSAAGKGSVVIKANYPNFGLPRYAQDDPRWADTIYNHSKSKIRTVGCALCSMAWVMSAFGDEIDPLQLNNWMNEEDFSDGGYNGASVNWDAIYDESGGTIDDDYHKNYNYDDDTYAHPPDFLDGYFAEGSVVIVQVANPKTGNQHWVVVTGEKTEDGNYSIIDPGSSSTSSLKDYKNEFWSYCVVSKSDGK